MLKNKRDPGLYLADIKICIKNIEKYTKGMDFENFIANQMVEDAVVRNLMIIGEAITQISKEIGAQYPTIFWREIIGMRNKIIHEYFGVDKRIVWNTIKDDLPKLKSELKIR